MTKAKYSKNASPAAKAEAQAAAAAKLTAALDRLEGAVSAIRSSADFKAYLQALAKFHRYSVNNQLLIAAQRPDATRVAGFNTWKALGRSVMKGAKGIQVLAPNTRKVEAEDGSEERRVCGFRVAHVFDVSQTSGEPLPPGPALKPIDGAGDPALWTALVTGAATLGSTVSTQALPPALGGYFEPATKQIVVNSRNSGAHQFKTLLHECVHLLESTTPAPLSYGTNEVIAESVAYAVCAHLGYDTADFSVGYVATWSGQTDVLRAVLTHVRHLTTTLIGWLPPAGATESTELEVAA